MKTNTTYEKPDLIGVAGAIALPFMVIAFPLLIALFLVRLIFSSKESAVFSGGIALILLVGLNPVISQVEIPVSQPVADFVDSTIKRANQILDPVF